MDTEWLMGLILSLYDGLSPIALYAVVKRLTLVCRSAGEFERSTRSSACSSVMSARLILVCAWKGLGGTLVPLPYIDDVGDNVNGG